MYGRFGAGDISEKEEVREGGGNWNKCMYAILKIFDL
jgi:hypothetical protein